MLKRIVFIAAMSIPQIASAADLSAPHRHKTPVRPVRQASVETKAIHCSTTDLFLFNVSTCGQGFDPLSFSAY